MNNRIHIFIEIALVIILIAMIIEHARVSDNVDFNLRDAGKLSIRAIREKTGQPPTFFISLNDRLIAEIFADDDMYHWIRILNYDGNGTCIQYDGKKNEPDNFIRDIQTGSHTYAISYNAEGDILEKIDKNKK